MKEYIWILLILLGLVILTMLFFIIVTIVLYKSTFKRQHSNNLMPKDWTPYLEKLKDAKLLILSNPNLTEHHIKSYDDKYNLCGYYIKSKNKSDILILLLHGYRSSGLSDLSLFYNIYKDSDFDVFAVDHRSHGKSEGTHIGFGTLDHRDVKEWLKYLKEKFPNKKIIIHGVSMGANTSLLLSDYQFDEVKGIIADCGYTSVYEQFKHIIKTMIKLPSGLLLKSSNYFSKKFCGYQLKEEDTKEHLKHSIRPILFIHGEKDTFVPTRFSKENYDSCVSDKELLIIENASHAQCALVDEDKYRTTVLNFVRKITNKDDKY
ncbi:MAG: alpha/beta fold hydrolase [Erysipelotrichales bacterium]|nr:alpha/beta fold hydrolase [Erysipelotrichales bacterium]